ncbi:MAG: AAA family ATPase [Prolixibacteraceae bacterium]
MKKDKIFEKKIFIVSGGPGFGKTELIVELQKSGYRCSGEFARDLIEAQLKIGGDVLPWKNPGLFQEEILKRRIEFFESVPEHEIAFADRGIPDQLAFARYKGFASPEILKQSAIRYRYSAQVFITPPWKEIFRNDLIRTETFEEAVRIDSYIRKTYAELNYQIIELPLKSVRKRVEFILDKLLKPYNNGH